GDEVDLRGPRVTDVAVRLTGDQLIRQVLQGGGNMPAYGKSLSPAETTALVAFLESCAPKGQKPARDSAEPGTPAPGASPATLSSRSRRRGSLTARRRAIMLVAEARGPGRARPAGRRLRARLAPRPAAPLHSFAEGAPRRFR